MLSQRGGLRVSYLAVSWCLPVQGHAAPNSALLEELPSSPLPIWQQPPLCSLSLKKPAPMTPLSLDPSVAYTDPGKL